MIATRDIRPGEEILAPYGGQCCKRLKEKLLAKIVAKTEAEEKSRTMIEAQFTEPKEQRRGGTAPNAESLSQKTIIKRTGKRGTCVTTLNE